MVVAVVVEETRECGVVMENLMVVVVMMVVNKKGVIPVGSKIDCSLSGKKQTNKVRRMEL